MLRVHSNDKTEQRRLASLMRDSRVTNVVVTTYDALKSGLRTSFRRILWRTIFLDEGHRIKNEDSDISQTCARLKARFKVILTGTPVSLLNEHFSQ